MCVARCSGRTRSSGSIAARTTACSRRTARSQRRSRAPVCRTASSSSAAGTTGRCGAARPRGRCSPSDGALEATRVLRRVAGLPLLVAVVFAATGWLYPVQPHAPGPRIGDALPLDELPNHAAAPLLWFLVVWSAAGLALGLYARWARIERLTAALVLGLAIGALSYLQVGLSLAVVRQISLRAALDVAARRQAVYLPAALVALAAAALATPRRGGRRGAAFVAAVVACGAFLNLLHALLPGEDASLLHSFTPDAVGPLAHALGVFAAVAMLVAARGLARRRP